MTVITEPAATGGATSVGSLKRAQGTRNMIAVVIPPLLIVVFTTSVNAIDRSTEPFGITGFSLLGQDVGWYGIAGFAALFSGPVLYSVFRAVYGGPSAPSCEAGDEAIALAEAEAAEEEG